MNGNDDSISINVNNDYIPISYTYSHNGAEIYTIHQTKNSIGLPTQIEYSGGINHTVNIAYNPDLTPNTISDGNTTKSYTYDSMGNTISYAIKNQNGVEISSYVFGYNQLGTLSYKKSTVENLGSSTENYSYNNLGNLSTYQCTGDICPKNEFSKTISSINYTYNNKFNTINQVIEKLNDGSTQKITYHYDNTDSSQVSSIDYDGHDSVKFTYDSNGDMTNLSEYNAGKLTEYNISRNATGQVESVINNSNGDEIQSYYDENGNIITENLLDKNGNLIKFINNIYINNQLLRSSDQENNISYSVSGGLITNGTYQSAIDDGKNFVSYYSNNKLNGYLTYMPFGRINTNRSTR